MSKHGGVLEICLNIPSDGVYIEIGFTVGVYINYCSDARAWRAISFSV